MRILFWLLLLANLLLFSYARWGDALTGTQADLQAQPPLDAGKIKVVSAPLAALPVPVQAPAMPAAPSVVVARPAPADTSAVCMEWGEFSGDDLARATTALTSMQLGQQLSQHEVEQDTGYWVYMPPQGSRANAKKKASELKALGVNDYFIVQESGKWHNAISLGVFRTRQAAQKHLDGLHQQGVRTAQVGERQARLKFTVFVFRNPDSALTARIAALQKGFPDSELKAAPCN
jgi:hypothetical protein